MIKHIVPSDDTRIHVRKIYQLKGGINKCSCGCGAEVTADAFGNIIVNHNYFDPVQWVNEILKDNR